VLDRSLVGARDLIARSLAEVRLTQGMQHREPILVAGFIEELTPATLRQTSRPDLCAQPSRFGMHLYHRPSAPSRFGRHRMTPIDSAGI